MPFFQDKKQKLLLKEIEQKDTYVASIIHDIKNPLIAHGRILEKLIKNLKDNEAKETCKQLLTSTRLMLEMVFSVSDTYKYDKGKIKYNFQEVNLFELTKEVCLELSSLTSEEDLINIKITGLSTVLADKMHIRRVISNLISNAIKYKKENTPIIVEIILVNKHIMFKVTNYGSYIKPEVQKILFNKYSSTNLRFNSHSTGLGLYLSNQIIEGHKGKMFAKSEISGINTFGFTIPNNIRISQQKLQPQTFF